MRGANRNAQANEPISLALQGGGAFGAFTWGVLDRLLEADRLRLDAASGASAGAVNAVLLADGLRQGGREMARKALDRFWTRLADDARSSFLPRGYRANLALDMSSRMLSPYQVNPFNLNPLRTLLSQCVDFDGLRAEPSLRLLIAATRVQDGTVRIFREDEVTLDSVLASACLPLVHQAVDIDGDAYWDGGYAANPPLLPLVEVSDAARVLLVQIVPTGGEDHPRTSPGIVKRLNQITFNAPLQHDLDAVAAMQRLATAEDATTASGRKFRALAIDHLSAEEWFPRLAERSANDLDRDFLFGLRDSGRTAATAWLGDQG